MVDKFRAACAIFEWVVVPLAGTGVTAPVPILEPWGSGVDDPLLFCVGMTETSFREASEIICLIFLFRRCDGFQWGLRKGRGLRVRSSRSRRCWWESSALGVDGAIWNVDQQQYKTWLWWRNKICRDYRRRDYSVKVFISSVCTYLGLASSFKFLMLLCSHRHIL